MTHLDESQVRSIREAIAELRDTIRIVDVTVRKHAVTDEPLDLESGSMLWNCIGEMAGEVHLIHAALWPDSENGDTHGPLG